MATREILRSVGAVVLHPAGLFSAGNTALAFGQAEPFAIGLNLAITAVVFAARVIEVATKRSLGIPFVIVAAVNFFTAISVEFDKALGPEGSQLFVDGVLGLSWSHVTGALAMFDLSNLFNLNSTVMAGHVSALALVAWGIGGLLAGRHERKSTTAQRMSENPQTYYGIGDMSAVNAGGTLNPFSFPFMVLGFIKSVFIGRPTRSKRKSRQFMYKEFTAARLYGVGYIVGAVTSLATLNFAIAQACWALGYFSFKKDT